MTPEEQAEKLMPCPYSISRETSCALGYKTGCDVCRLRPSVAAALAEKDAQLEIANRKE